MRKMGIGLGVGINRSNYAQGIFGAYATRVVADGGVVESGSCVDAVSSLLQSASLLLIPSGYKGGKLYAEIPTNGNGDLTWTRTSTAIRTNSSGLLESMGSGVPRLSYMYGSCPAVLAEPQRTNLALWSEDFSNAIYTKTSVTVTANSTTAPDGNMTADTLSKSAGVDATCTQEIIATSTGYAGTVFIKQDNDETRFPEFFLRSSSSSGQNEIYVQLNTKTGAIATRLTTGTTSASTPVLINGYWRMSLYVLANSNTVRVGLRPAAGTTLGVFNANASGSIVAWGLQVEPNAAYPTTYIPTTSGATATRVADSFSRSNIYTNGLISASGGTWFVELRNNVAYTRDSIGGVWIGDNTTSGTLGNTLVIRNGGPDRLSIGKTISGTFASLYTTTTNTTKIAIKWNGTTADIFANGTKVVSATAFTPTNMENLVGNANDVPKFIQQMALFPTPLSDTDCTTLTTL